MVDQRQEVVEVALLDEVVYHDYMMGAPAGQASRPERIHTLSSS